MRLAFSLKFLILFLSFSLSAGADEHDELIIEINQGVVRPITLAVAEFAANNDDLVETIRDIMVNNFRLSGHLETIPAADMPNNPFRENQVLYSTWRRENAEYLVFGNMLSESRNIYEINISVADVLGENIRASRVFRFDRRYSRDFAHYLSDYVYKVITGLDGSFSTKIAYVKRTTNSRGRNRNRVRYNLIIADADGGRERTILTSEEPLSSPSWSPDSKKIAYVSFEYGFPYIFVQEIQSGRRQVVTDYRGINSAPAWSPDGKNLAVVLSYGANAEIFVVNLDENINRRITNNDAIDTEPSWSRDGTKLLFTSDRSGRPQIYEFDLETSELSHLIRNNSYSASASYIKNNSVVMINSYEGRDAVVRYDVGTAQTYEISSNRLNDSPSISPDGNRVVYSTKAGGRNQLAIASVDLGNSVYLENLGGDVTSVAWSPFIFNFNF